MKMLKDLQKRFQKSVEGWTENTVRGRSSFINLAEKLLWFMRDNMILSSDYGSRNKDGQIELSMYLVTINAALDALSKWRGCGNNYYTVDDTSFKLVRRPDVEGTDREVQAKFEAECEKHWATFWALFSAHLRDWESVGL